MPHPEVTRDFEKLENQFLFLQDFFLLLQCESFEVGCRKRWAETLIKSWFVPLTSQCIWEFWIIKKNFGLSKQEVSSVHLLHLWNFDYHNKKQNAEEFGHKSNNPRKSDNSMQWFSDTFAASDQCFIFVNIGSNHTSSTFENTLQMDLSSDILLKVKLFQLFLRFEHLVEFFLTN